MRDLIFVGTGLLLGWSFSWNWTEPEPIAQEIPILGPEIPTEQQLSERFVQEMADEFRIAPEIVEAVHRNAVKSVDPAEPEWRLLRSPEALTYVILSLIHTESGGDPQAIGDNGRARGLTQIWHTTASSYGPVTPDALLDPETNIEFAFKHFRYLLKKYKGNFPLALYGWNRGTGTVDRLIRYGNSPANGYGRKVYQASLKIKKRYGLDAIGN